MEGNCMKCCKHFKYKDIIKRKEIKDEDDNVVMITNDIVGQEHYCEINSEHFEKWWKENGHKHLDEANNNNLPCYCPEEFYYRLNKAIEATEKILNILDK